MRNCIPDEMFNRIPYPDYGSEQVGIERIFREARYKVSLVPDLTLKKEIWHALCDFCSRTGALLERNVGSGGSCDINPSYGRFMRVVGAGTASGKTKDITVSDNGTRVSFGTDEDNYVIYSVRPEFSSEDGDIDGGTKVWNPKVPDWFVEKYGECIAHGGLMRVFAMASKPWADFSQARMHAVAYNSDLNMFSWGLITSGMRKDLMVDIEDLIVNTANGNG